MSYTIQLVENCVENCDAVGMTERELVVRLSPNYVTWPKLLEEFLNLLKGAGFVFDSKKILDAVHGATDV